MDVWRIDSMENWDSEVAQSDAHEQSWRDDRHDALVLVEDAVKRHTRYGTSTNILRPSLEALGNLARSDGIPPERLIIELKQALNRMPALARLDPLARSDIAARVVLLAIEAYYGDGATSA